jgi:2-polyprenyl-3-methyl-5-hydroxy-6-metoxy-1,4-benzoquinol methylase
VSLAHVGFRVKAIDFNEQLLSELANNSKQAEVEIINADIRQFRKYVADPPEVIICWGDTLTHLASKKEMYEFIRNMAGSLATGGRLLLSFRDYSRELTGDSRFIHVKSDEHRILTCFLEYAPEHIHITDLLYEKNGQHWQQKVSSYKKVRITPEEVAAQISNHGLRIYWQEFKNGMVKILALK